MEPSTAPKQKCCPGAFFHSKQSHEKNGARCCRTRRQSAILARAIWCAVCFARLACSLKCVKRMWKIHDAVVHSDPEVMSGTPVFVGTRVPFQTLIDYLEAGRPLAEFLDDFRRCPGNRRSPPSNKPKTLSSPVRVLLDECLPHGLKRELVGHDVRTTPEMGWASRRNGDLLRAGLRRIRLLRHDRSQTPTPAEPVHVRHCGRRAGGEDNSS